jgi:secretion/DNA translocation related TadE-like protein
MRTGACPMRSSTERDRGAASILVLAIGLIMVGAGMAGAAIGTARVGRHQARTAADLAALAGAMRASEGSAAACARATEIVQRNDGRMLTCRLIGWEIVVTAGVQVTFLPGRRGEATATARAGPIRAG